MVVIFNRLALLENSRSLARVHYLKYVSTDCFVVCFVVLLQPSENFRYKLLYFSFP